jgi:hypothetical protein
MIPGAEGAAATVLEPYAAAARGDVHAPLPPRASTVLTHDDAISENSARLTLRPRRRPPRPTRPCRQEGARQCAQALPGGTRHTTASAKNARQARNNFNEERIVVVCGLMLRHRCRSGQRNSPRDVRNRNETELDFLPQNGAADRRAALPTSSVEELVSIPRLRIVAVLDLHPGRRARRIVAPVLRLRHNPLEVLSAHARKERAPATVAVIRIQHARVGPNHAPEECLPLHEREPAKIAPANRQHVQRRRSMASRGGRGAP